MTKTSNTNPANMRNMETKTKETKKKLFVVCVDGDHLEYDAALDELLDGGIGQEDEEDKDKKQGIENNG